MEQNCIHIREDFVGTLIKKSLWLRSCRYCNEQGSLARAEFLVHSRDSLAFAKNYPKILKTFF